MTINLLLGITVGIDIDVNWNDVIRQTSLRRFKAHKGKLFLSTAQCDIDDHDDPDMSPFVGMYKLTSCKVNHGLTYGFSM